MNRADRRKSQRIQRLKDKKTDQMRCFCFKSLIDDVRKGAIHNG